MFIYYLFYLPGRKLPPYKLDHIRKKRSISEPSREKTDLTPITPAQDSNIFTFPSVVDKEDVAKKTSKIDSFFNDMIQNNNNNSQHFCGQKLQPIIETR